MCGHVHCYLKKKKKTFLVSEFLAHLCSLHKLYITCMICLNASIMTQISTPDTSVQVQVTQTSKVIYIACVIIITHALGFKKLVSYH